MHATPLIYITYKNVILSVIFKFDKTSKVNKSFIWMNINNSLNVPCFVLMKTSE